MQAEMRPMPSDTDCVGTVTPQQRTIHRHLLTADGQPLTKRHLENVSGSERIAARVGELIHNFNIPVEGVWMRDVETGKRVYGYRLPVQAQGSLFGEAA